MPYTNLSLPGPRRIVGAIKGEVRCSREYQNVRILLTNDKWRNGVSQCMIQHTSKSRMSAEAINEDKASSGSHDA